MHISTTVIIKMKKKNIYLELNLAEMKLCSKLLADNQITQVYFKKKENVELYLLK